MPLLDIPPYGEWGAAAVGLGLVFLVASGGVVGLGWYVLRGDRLNRSGEVAEPSETSSEPH